MSNFLHSLTVVLEEDTREEDAEIIILAIKQMRGVLAVTSHIADINSYMAETRARNDLAKRIQAVLEE